MSGRAIPVRPLTGGLTWAEIYNSLSAIVDQLRARVALRSDSTSRPRVPGRIGRRVSSAPVAMGEIEVEFAGDTLVVAERLTFGRAGQLELDTNRHLHRLVGEFVRRDGRWWLDNLGSRLFITLVGGDGTRIDLAPGASQSLGGPGGSLLIQAGQARYEVSYRLTAAPVATPTAPSVEVGATVDFSTGLTPREVDVLVTFARQVLDGTNGPPPTYVEVAQTWDLATKTVDNTVQSIKRKLRNSRLARDEPLDALARIAVSHSLITHADLEWSRLNTTEPPRPALLGPRFAAATITE